MVKIAQNLRKLMQQFEREYETHNLIEISRSAVMHNYDLLQEVAKVQPMPVLKSNAYGHGIQKMAEILKGRNFPYACVDGFFEALRIREVSNQPVLIMGAVPPQNFSRIPYDNYAFTVQDEATIKGLGATRKRIKIHLDINTGMHRYGIEPHELDQHLALIRAYPYLELEGISSHLADADNVDTSYTDRQVLLFDSLIEKVCAAGFAPSLVHLANVPGCSKVKSRYTTAFRPGIGIYGVNPLSSEDPKHAKLARLRPALSLKSTITKVRMLKRGDRISYNGTFTAKKAMRIGVLPLGYYEGVPRSLSNVGIVNYGDIDLPIVGRICMNHMMIDLQDTDAQVGDTVTVFSSNPSKTNSIANLSLDHYFFSYGLLAKLSPDVRRSIVK